MTYHVSRVDHRIQAASLEHYPTSISRQVFMPPGAEIPVAQISLLWGGESRRRVRRFAGRRSRTEKRLPQLCGKRCREQCPGRRKWSPSSRSSPGTRRAPGPGRIGGEPRGDVGP
jgi:hypothetical protein